MNQVKKVQQDLDSDRWDKTFRQSVTINLAPMNRSQSQQTLVLPSAAKLGKAPTGMGRSASTLNTHELAQAISSPINEQQSFIRQQVIHKAETQR